jgi:carbon monoxide dehydrogenase subunit G
MAFSFGGAFDVQRSPEQVYAFLTDPKRFCPLMPEYQSMTMQDDRHFTVKVNVGVAHIRGAADVKMELAKAEPPRRAEYTGHGCVAGGNVNLTAGFDLAPAGEGTHVTWTGQAQVFGRIISMAGGLLEPLAKKNIQKMIDALQQALNTTSAEPQPAGGANRG